MSDLALRILIVGLCGLAGLLVAPLRAGAEALTLGAGLITAEQQRALQMELANLDAAIRREAMALQNQQFNDTLGFNIGNQEAYWNAVAAGLID